MNVEEHARLRALYPITVSRHARERLHERFPGVKAARIPDEVRNALLAGRISRSKPRGLRPPDRADTLYAWTPDGERVYALQAGRRSFHVYTTMRAEEARERNA